MNSERLSHTTEATTLTPHSTTPNRRSRERTLAQSPTERLSDHSAFGAFLPAPMLRTPRNAFVSVDTLNALEEPSSSASRLYFPASISAADTYDYRQASCFPIQWPSVSIVLSALPFDISLSIPSEDNGHIDEPYSQCFMTAALTMPRPIAQHSLPIVNGQVPISAWAAQSIKESVTHLTNHGGEQVVNAWVQRCAVSALQTMAGPKPLDWLQTLADHPTTLTAIVHQLGAEWLNLPHHHEQGLPLLHQAMHERYSANLVTALLEAGVAVNEAAADRQNNRTPLHQLFHSPPLYRLSDRPRFYGNPEFLYAVSRSQHHRHWPIHQQTKARQLLAFGANIDSRNRRGQTPLHEAILALEHCEYQLFDRQEATAPAVQFLLDQGASLSAHDHSGHSARYFATKKTWIQYSTTIGPGRAVALERGHPAVQRLINNQLAQQREALTAPLARHFPFFDHYRGVRNGSIEELRMFPEMANVEARQDWQEFLVYRMLYRDIQQTPNSLPATFGQQSYYSNHDPLPVQGIPMEALKIIARFSFDLESAD